MVLVIIILIFLALVVVGMIAGFIIIVIDAIATIPVLSFYLIFIEHDYDKAINLTSDLMTQHFILFPIITVAVILLCIAVGYYGRLCILLTLSNVFAAFVYDVGDFNPPWYVFIPVGFIAIMVGVGISRVIEPHIPCMSSVMVQRITSGAIGIFGIFIAVFGYWYLGIGSIGENPGMLHIIATVVLSLLFTVGIVFITERYIATRKE